jgi:hypothetical protein
LDSDIQPYLTSWRIPTNADWAPRVTLRQLLSHTAGVSVHGFAGYPATGPWPTVTRILNGSPPANNLPIIVDLIPGLQFRYSGGGTTIAQAAVTDLLEQPLPEIMRELVFDPLALENTTFAQPLPLGLAARSATAHPWNGVPMPGRWRVHPEMAAAGLWTTAGDLARIGCAFLDSLHGDPSTLGLSRIVSRNGSNRNCRPICKVEILSGLVGAAPARAMPCNITTTAGTKALSLGCGYIQPWAKARRSCSTRIRAGRSAMKSRRRLHANIIGRDRPAKPSFNRYRRPWRGTYHTDHGVVCESRSLARH